MNLNQLLLVKNGKKMDIYSVLLDGEYKGYRLKEVLNWDPQYVMEEIVMKNPDMLEPSVVEYIKERHAKWATYYKSVGYNINSLTEG
jgi:hypothetical protein